MILVNLSFPYVKWGNNRFVVGYVISLALKGFNSRWWWWWWFSSLPQLVLLLLAVECLFISIP